MEVEQGIIHGIIKDNNSDSAAVDTRTECLPIDAKLNKLAEDVLAIYGRQSNSYGTFDPDEDSYPFPALLRELLNDESALGYVDFSTRTLNLIAARMGQESFATGGYTLILKYSNQGRDWLLIVMLKLKAGTGVDVATKALTDVTAFDVEHLHEAARIDIDKWVNNEQPYLTFVKRKSSGQDVTRYFRLALGCTEYTDSAKNTKEAVRAVNEFSANQNWNPEKKRLARQALLEYCEEKTAAGESVNLESLSSRINDQDPGAFRDFIRDGDYEVNDEFEAHKTTYKKLRRLSAKMGNVSVAFDVGDLVSGRIRPDYEAHTLTVAQITPQLEEKIREALGNGNTD